MSSVFKRFWRFAKRYSLAVYVLLLSLIFVAMLLAPRIFITIPAGHIGVMWLHFLGGTVTDRYYGEGMHVIFPWDRMVIYDARLQNTARTYDTISSNGLSMEVEIAVRYRLDTDSAGLLHKMVGPNYPEILVYPEIGSHTRELIARYTPEQLYTETRAFIQAEILERMVTELGSSLVGQTVRGKMLHIEDVLIRSVKLPNRVAEAIERKAEQQQIMLEYDFRIAREEKERDRKRVEAEGVRDFQSIVARTITDEYLRLRGIDATLSLASSNNSKMIVIGGRDGLPIILNTADSTSTPTSTDGVGQASNNHNSDAARMLKTPQSSPPLLPNTPHILDTPSPPSSFSTGTGAGEPRTTTPSGFSGASEGATSSKTYDYDTGTPAPSAPRPPAPARD